MRFFLLLLLISTFLLGISRASSLDPTLYEYYTSSGVKEGLRANTSSDHFTLNHRPYIIYGGSAHYFRIRPQYWRQTLARMRSSGLNAVQLYLPWNLHEEKPGDFDFTSDHLNLAKYLEEIKAADMFAIVRPGPYICAEWEFGGFPSWLLRDPKMKLRSAYPGYLRRIKLYWEQAMKIINKYQFTGKENTGPVIMLQLENEYFGAFWMEHSAEYLRFLQQITRDSGFKELLFTSDPGFAARQLPTKGIFVHNSTSGQTEGEEVLETANFNDDSLEILTTLKKVQPGKPAFVSEFWPGWFDSWNETHHHTYTLEHFEKEVGDVLFKANGSINFYMFIGGTNFGFMNGGRVVTSYDYDAPLSESGNYTAKYHKIREFYLKLVSTGRLPKLRLPELPKIQEVASYGNVPITEFLPLESMLKHTKKWVNISKPVPMELLDIGDDYGQRFGFILYRTIGRQVASYEVTGPIADQAVFMVRGDKFTRANFTEDGPSFLVEVVTYPIRLEDAWYSYDLLVENMGRLHDSDTMDEQRKGIINSNQTEIKLDGTAQRNISIFSLDFETEFLNNLNSKEKWTLFKAQTGDVAHLPAMYRTTLKIQGQPKDTWLQMIQERGQEGWTKGNVFVNGFNLGRYWNVGPTKTMYLPAPLLRSGDNEIAVFELGRPGTELSFVEHPILE